MSERIIGIDLGTTNSLAATVFEDGPEVICEAGQSPIIPSILTRQQGQWIVGEAAKPYRFSDPHNTLYSIKRLMGRDMEELEDVLNQLPYQIKAAQRQLVKVVIQDQEYTPQELSAQILKKVKAHAEAVLEHPVHKAVITVPAYFDDAQRQATRDAGKLAGLEVVRILNEPTAAAIAYGLDEKKDGTVAVFDLGGGTFDISILSLKGKLFKVLSTHGDTQLGGDDIDQALVGQILNDLRQRHPNQIFEDASTIQQLKRFAESIKMELSGAPETEQTLTLPGLSEPYVASFTREQLNALIEPLMRKALASCGKALKDAQLQPEDITDVVLVGGSTVVPYVRQQVREFFQKPPHVAIDPYKVVAIGAGIQGHLLSGGRRDFVLLDVIPLALGIETLGGTFSKIISSNTTLPAEATEMFTTHVDNQTGIEVNIFQGERELVKDCRALGRFRLKGIPPMKAGLPLVEMTFKVDANGILTVTAKEQRSGQSAQIDIIPFHGLTSQEIDQIMEDSFEHAEEDFNERQLIEFRQVAERVLRGIEENWHLAQSDLNATQQMAIQAQMEAVSQTAKAKDAAALKLQIDKLGDLTRPLADLAIGRAVLTELQKGSSN